jgi:hypothetical protein
MATRIETDVCEPLARKAATGDALAAQALIEYLWPHWLELVRGNVSMGPLAASEDHVFNVATRLVAKFGEPSGRALGLYLAWRETHGGQDFGDWVRIVVKNLVRSYVREQLGAPQPSVDLPSPKRLLNDYTLAPKDEELWVRPPMTQEQTARELMEYAKLKLPAQQLQALTVWLEGGALEDLETAFKLPAGHGRRLVRAAIAVLRRHFTGAIDEIDMGTA